jgi:hypothetical protein
MLRHPTIKAHLRAGAVPGEGVILVSEEGSWTLQGPLFEEVLPLLDGVRTPEQIAAALAPAVPAEVYYVLEFLEKKGHLMDRGPGLDAPHEAYWAGLGLDPGSAWAALRSGRVRIRSAGQVDSAPLLRSLEEAGLDLAAGDPGLEIVVTDDYLRGDLLRWATAAREAGLPWMPLRPLGQEFWIGPLCPARPPASSACFSCLQHRLRRNQQVQEFLRRRNGWPDPLPTAVAALPAAVGAACRLAAVGDRQVPGRSPPQPGGPAAEHGHPHLGLQEPRPGPVPLLPRLRRSSPAAPRAGASGVPSRRPLRRERPSGRPPLRRPWRNIAIS